MNKTSGFYVDCAKVAQYKDIMATTRLLAVDLMENPYITIGDFLKSISDTDLKSYVNMVDEVKHDDDKLKEFILLAMMLSAAEGLNPDSTVSEIQNRASQMMMFITFESLHRKGLVKLYHENVSFGDEYGDKTIVERIDNE